MDRHVSLQCSRLVGLALTIATAVLPYKLAADDFEVFGGLSVQSSDSGLDVFPVLIIEAGRLTFGLDQTTVLLAETDDYDLLAGIRVDSHPKCKFCIKTERCTEAYEWDAATLP